MTGTDSAILAGCKAQLQTWKRKFTSPERSVYLRKPDAVIASPAAPIAMEHDHWREIRASNGTLLASGSYSAKWREMRTEWVPAYHCGNRAPGGGDGG